jgi:hypothetical protein
MKRIIATFIAVLSITGLSFSQQWKTAPLELYGGISNLLYFGDIGGASSESSLMGIKDFRFSKIRPGITLGARYQVMKPLTLRASYT